MFIAIQAITPAVIITLVSDFIFRNIKPDIAKIEEIEIHSGMISWVFNHSFILTAVLNSFHNAHKSAYRGTKHARLHTIRWFWIWRLACRTWCRSIMSIAIFVDQIYNNY